MKVILGLDISTSCIGWCLLRTSDGSLVGAGHIPLKNLKCMFAKAQRAHEALAEVADSHAVEAIAIEENLQAFRPGFSSAKTLITLARFNGIVSWLSYKCTNLQPDFINVNHARKSVGLKIDRKSTLTTKEQVFEWAKVNGMADFPWPTRMLKSGPRRNHVIFDDCCYDISDAFVIAKAYVNNE